LVFLWSKNENQLKEKGFSITYVADPEMKGLKSTISVRDGEVIINNIPYMLNDSKIKVAE